MKQIAKKATAPSVKRGIVSAMVIGVLMMCSTWNVEHRLLSKASNR